MTRGTFLEELRIALQGQIPQIQVNEHLKYYETYIIEESRKGRTEEEVIQSLGSPRLIAKTIILLAENGTYQEPESGNSKKEGVFARFFGFFVHTRFGRVLLVSVLAALAVRISVLLLPVLMAVILIGAILRVIYLIFFGNKK